MGFVDASRGTGGGRHDGDAGAPGAAFAHLERPSYWPDPAPDTSRQPGRGREGADARSLTSAVSGSGPGEVLVVCKGEAASRLARAAGGLLDQAREKGYRLRPSQPRIEGLQGRGQPAAEDQQGAGEAVRLRLGPARRLRRRQQRPRRDHARPLHGARVAQHARERPDAATRACCSRTPAATWRRATATRSPAPTTRT